MAQSTDIAEKTAMIQVGGLGPGMHGLDLGWGGAACGSLLLETGAEITFIADDIRERDRSLNMRQVTAMLASGPSEAISEPVDVALYRPAQRAAKGQVFEWVDGAFRALKVSGSLILAGRKDRGVESYAKRMKDVFGNCALAGRTGRLRVYRAEKKQELSGTEPFDSILAFGIDDIVGAPYQIETMAGVFSRDGLDPGTELLIEHLTVDSVDRILDWGCGWGMLGMVAGRMAPESHITLLDASFRAVTCARKNLTENDIKNATVEVKDGCVLEDYASYDLVVSNPPFHEGNAVAHPLIENASRLLKTDGKLILVVMREGPCLKHMERVFGNARIIAQRDGYSILSATLGTSL